MMRFQCQESDSQQSSLYFFFSEDLYLSFSLVGFVLGSTSHFLDSHVAIIGSHMVDLNRVLLA